MPDTTPADTEIPVADVADELGVARRTVQSWIASGRIVGRQPVPGPRAPYVVPVTEVERVKREMSGT